MTASHAQPGINSQIWNLMIDADCQFRYFYMKADRYRKWSRWMNILVFLGSLFAATFLFLKLDVAWAFFATGSLFYVIAILTVLEMFLQLSKSAGIAENSSRQCDIISAEAKRLWRRLGSDDDSALVALANELETRLSIATHVEIDYDHKLHQRCEQNAQTIISNEFGARHQDVSAEDAVANTAPSAATATTSA